MARTPDTNRLIGPDGNVAFGTSRKLHRYAQTMEAFHLARFRRTLPRDVDLLIPRLEVQEWQRSWSGRRGADDATTRTPTLAHDLSTIPRLDRILRAVETAPTLAEPIGKGVGHVVAARRAADPAKAATYDSTPRINDPAAWDATAKGRGRAQGHIVMALAAGGSPFDAVARHVETMTSGTVSRREARQLAGFAGRSDDLHRAATVLDALRTANPNAGELRPREVAAIAATGFLGLNGHPSRPTAVAAFVEAFKVEGRTGSGVRKPAALVTDTLHGARVAMAGLGVPAPDTLYALTRSFAPRGRNMKGLERIGEAWHAGVGVRNAERVGLVRRLVEADEAARGAVPVDLSARYPAPAIAPPQVPGMAIRQLRSDEAMAAEGREMDHCVASFAGDAAGGDLLVFSVEGARGHSTAGYVVEGRPEGRLELTRKQHTGVHNAAPEPENARAMERHVAALNADPSWMAACAADRVEAARAEGKANRREAELSPASKARLRAFDSPAMRRGLDVGI